MLPDIPDNDASTCWVPGCTNAVPRCDIGLCFFHVRPVRLLMAAGHEPTGRLYDLLGMRLNVLAETKGACLRAPGPCEIVSCRHHCNDRLSGESVDLDEPCSIKLAERGGMTLDEIAVCLGGVTRERIRQLEEKALRSLKRACEKAGIRLEDLVGFRAKDAA